MWIRVGLVTPPLLTPKRQSEGRPTIEELDKFADEMNDLIDSFCNRTKTRVQKFVNKSRQFATK